MRADEVRGTARLAGLAMGGGARRIAEVHQGIAGRVFGALGPAAVPVRVVHDAISGFTHAVVRTSLDTGARAVGAVVAVRATGTDADAAPAARAVLAVLNGMHGDLVQREVPALALPMSVRVDDRVVPAETPALRAAFPDAGSRLVVFLHGLTETEHSWRYRAARRDGGTGLTYGDLLHRDLGSTPVYLRYNTGLHVSDNGRALDRLLGELVDAWPVPVEDLVLIGHSMGGLVARSALHQAGSGTPDARGWTRLVRDTVTLGTPHLGAPLERGVHRLASTLARLPETRPLARVLTLRSAGIKDLRCGTLVEGDWSGRDLDAADVAAHTHVPLHDGARHFVVLATVTRDPEARSARLLGDLLVPPLSATGDTGDDDRLAFPPDHVHRLGSLHHLDLLNHPRVYAQIRRWLESRPEGPRPTASGGVDGG